MRLVDTESGSELLQGHAHIWNHIFNFINSMSLKCAVQLGIPDIIHNHGKPITLAQLVAALPVHPTKSLCVHRLMRILVHSGFFTLQKVSVDDPEEGYVLTTASQLLLKNHPFSVTPFLLSMLDPLLIAPWQQLSTWFQDDVPTPFATAHGVPFWECAGQDPNLNQSFNEGMASDARFVASMIIDKCKDVFEGLNSLVDVGGGTGTVAKSITQAFPHLECTVFDLPHVVADLQSDHGNLKYLGGDMFETVPPADAILLKWILHDWNDEECVKILKKCREAITSNNNLGKVIIIDMVIGNQKENESTETQLFFDMLMMTLVTGKERDEKEWAKLFLEAGFSCYKIIPILGLRSLIEVYP